MSLLSEIRKKINIQDLSETGQLNGNLIQRAAKLEKIAIFSEIKSEHPDYSNKQICDAMQISPSTMIRIRKDLAVKSPYRYDIATPKRKKKEETKSEEINQTEKTEQSKILTTSNKAGRVKRKEVVPSKKDPQNIPAGADMYLSSDNEIDDLLKNAGGQYNS